MSPSSTCALLQFNLKGSTGNVKIHVMHIVVTPAYLPTAAYVQFSLEKFNKIV